MELLVKLFAKMPAFLSAYRGGDTVTFQKYIIPATWSFTLQFRNLQSSGEIFNSLASNTFEHEDKQLVYSKKRDKLFIRSIKAHRPEYYKARMTTDTNGNIVSYKVYDEDVAIDPKALFHFDLAKGILTVEWPTQHVCIDTKEKSWKETMDINGKVKEWRKQPNAFFQIRRLSSKRPKYELEMESFKEFIENNNLENYHGKIYAIGHKTMEFNLRTEESREEFLKDAMSCFETPFDPKSFLELAFESGKEATLIEFNKKDLERTEGTTKRKNLAEWLSKVF